MSMSVKIRIPDETGDIQRMVPVLEAQDIANRLLSQRYIMSINGDMKEKAEQIVDGDTVQFYPAITGG